MVRTPQEISNPTPPADTTPPCSASKAATPPIGNPYPQWASGMAYAAPTIPGRLATLHSCWRTLSSMSASSASSAYNTAGTRISPSGSMTQRLSPSRRMPCRFTPAVLSSDVEDALGTPAPVRALAHQKFGERRALDLDRRRVSLDVHALAAGLGVEFTVDDGHLVCREQQVLRGHVEDEVVEPLVEQQLEIGGAAVHRDRDERPDARRVGDDGRERHGRLLECLGDGLAPAAHPDVCAVREVLPITSAAGRGRARRTGPALAHDSFSCSFGSLRRLAMRACSCRLAASNASRSTTYTSSWPSRCGRSMSTTTSSPGNASCTLTLNTLPWW